MFKCRPIIRVFQDDRIIVNATTDREALDRTIGELMAAYNIEKELSREVQKDYVGPFIEAINVGPLEHVYCLARFPQFVFTEKKVEISE